ncbi:Nitronate monooxygenase [Crateriforma conspicua]|uniref:Nitronate monooxygenase n=1 Tax=Crateriforma conspicua TaxID=2527996 RepID=A0A5C6FS32_9PLAN|nr:nitronate monooxygenase [Crateriforma conspicua]TWU63313.1 Nitronate monooxygenase [Crateriforma conspicua]
MFSSDATAQEPVLIQGGMGAAVSNWRLAKAVAMTGQLGVVSGTAMDVVLSRRLQLGDPGGHMRRALADFPFPEMARRILDKFYVPDGKEADQPFRGAMVITDTPTTSQLELVVVANFVEVWLAKEDHDGPIGINLLEKIQTPTLASLYGAMLAGVDYVLMGAGIPKFIPGALDRLSRGEAAELPLHILDTDQPVYSRFDPVAFGAGEITWLNRPKFLAIVASATLASMLAKKSTGKVDGFIIEGPTAGGHNAPPRGRTELNDRGEPVYGRRDVVKLAEIAKIGLPFWLAGSYGSADAIEQAIAEGATGVQVGTPFAFCQESGLSDGIKSEVIQRARAGKLDVHTDPLASPTGFPFKVLQLNDTMSELPIYEERKRICDLGFLRQGYLREDGKTGWRCPAEPVDDYVRKGGKVEDTVGRKCVCNGLLADIGLAQTRKSGETELPLVTCGNDVVNIGRFLPSDDAIAYSAADVVETLLTKMPSAEVATTV